MATPPRAVPTTHAELAAAIEGGVFPHERNWIDFKRRLYPEDGDGAARDKVSAELARDMASMAALGGFLIYGVKENKINHTFTVDEMPLPVGLHETVDAIARDRITPSLTVIPTLVGNPETSNTGGFLVIEIPESDDSPHMADFTYWGRSETSRIRLGDDQVERLITARARRSERLGSEMQATENVNPIGPKLRRESNFFFTAVPTRGWPDMFAAYTRDRKARLRLVQRCADLTQEIRRADGDQRVPIAYAAVMHEFRTQRVAAGWATTWVSKPTGDDGDKMIGLDDDGPIRYINQRAGGPLQTNTAVPLIYEMQLLHETRDMIRLVASFADEAGYPGTWLLGVHLDRMGHRVSQLADPSIGSGIFSAPGPFDDNYYTATTRATSHEIHDQAELLTDRLMRKLLRGLGSEFLLSRPPFAPD